jgi:hypothetical protein
MDTLQAPPRRGFCVLATVQAVIRKSSPFSACAKPGRELRYLTSTFAARFYTGLLIRRFASCMIWRDRTGQPFFPLPATKTLSSTSLARRSGRAAKPRIWDCPLTINHMTVTIRS